MKFIQEFMSDATWYLVGVTSIIFLVMFVVMNIIIVHTPVLQASYAEEKKQRQIANERSKLEMTIEDDDDEEDEEGVEGELPTSSTGSISFNAINNATTTIVNLSTELIDDNLISSGSRNLNNNALKIEEAKKHK